jgi:ATP-binding cassette subfamily B protein
MASLLILLPFVRRYRREAAYSLTLLLTLVVFDLALPRLIQRMIDDGIRVLDQRVVIGTALSMLGISAASFAVAIGNNAYSVRAAEGVARDLRNALFAKIQSFSYRNLDEERTGQLLVVLTSDVLAIKALVQISLRIGTRAPLMMVGSAILMVLTSRELVMALLPVLVGATVLIVAFILKTEPLVRALQSKLDALNGVLQENISGARLVKSLVREDFEGQRFGEVNGEASLASTRLMTVTASMMPALTLCVNLGTVVVIWLGGQRAIEGELTVGQVVAFANYLLSTMVPLVMMTMLANTWAAGLASSTRIARILTTVPDVRDSPNAATLDEARSPIDFDDVGFEYGPCQEPALAGVRLHVRAGQTIALLGPTGAGKSTLVHLIPRFYDVTHGALSIGTLNVRHVQQASLRRLVAIVPQESLLFSGTIRDNITYGRPSASDAEVRLAARIACADDFIERMNGGYDAVVAPRGSNLSGGQKQRIAIARALVMRPDVLILDDSTSAVDVETEKRIHAGIRKDGGVTTTFVVAQRVSTVLSANQICLLDQGKIIARGTHAELLRSSPEYLEIYESQLGATPSASVSPSRSPS